MKQIVFLSLGLLTAASAFAQAPRQVEPAASKLIWTGSNITGPHSGTINVAAGTVLWNAAGLEAASLTFDMTSIKNTDMKEEMAGKLERHLRSEDFFNTEVFRTAAFKTTKVEPITGAETGRPNYTVTGDLTVKGITKPITFPVLAWKDGTAIRVAGKAVFNRADHDVRFRSATFFNDLGDKIIDDQVELAFDVSAN